MNNWGNPNESWGVPPQHQHFHPNVFAGIPATQVGHHLGGQTIGGFSSTDPWLNSSPGLPTNIHHNYGTGGAFF